MLRNLQQYALIFDGSTFLTMCLLLKILYFSLIKISIHLSNHFQLLKPLLLMIAPMAELNEVVTWERATRSGNFGTTKQTNPAIFFAKLARNNYPSTWRCSFATLSTQSAGDSARWVAEISKATWTTCQRHFTGSKTKTLKSFGEIDSHPEKEVTKISNYK